VSLAATLLGLVLVQDLGWRGGIGFGGVFADNPGLIASAAWNPTRAAAADARVRLRADAGAGYLRYLTLVGLVSAEIALGRDAATAPTLIVGAGWAFDRDAAGGAAFSTHELIARLAIEAPIAGRLYATAELAPVRYPIAASSTSGGRTISVDPDPSDATWMRAGIGLGLRL
jgi:hypothetical protein